MKTRTGLALAAVLFAAHAALAFERPAPPQILFGALYADVEFRHIFRTPTCALRQAGDCPRQGATFAPLFPSPANLEKESARVFRQCCEPGPALARAPPAP